MAFAHCRTEHVLVCARVSVLTGATAVEPSEDMCPTAFGAVSLSEVAGPVACHRFQTGRTPTLHICRARPRRCSHLRQWCWRTRVRIRCEKTAVTLGGRGALGIYPREAAFIVVAMEKCGRQPIACASNVDCFTRRRRRISNERVCLYLYRRPVFKEML